jgi:hypothetical protein
MCQLNGDHVSTGTIAILWRELGNIAKPLQPEDTALVKIILYAAYLLFKEKNKTYLFLLFLQKFLEII